MKLLGKWLICVITLLALNSLFPQNVIADGPVTLIIAGSILWLINILLRPLVQLLSLPITMITFGLFSVIVNAGMVALTDSILADFKIESFWFCLLIAVILSVFNTAFGKTKSA